MPNEATNKADQDTEATSVTIWLAPATLRKLNKLVLARSSAKRIVNRQEIIRELIEKEKP